MSAKPTPVAKKAAKVAKPAPVPAAKPAPVPAAKKPAKPVKVLPDIKLTTAQINALCVLHAEGKTVSVDTLAQSLAVPAKSVTPALAKLKELGLAEETPKGWRFSGLRCKALTLLVDNLRVNGGPMSASELGTAMWADPKVSAKDPKAAVRYIAPAGAVLKTAFALGVVYKLTTDGAVPMFGVIA